LTSVYPKEPSKRILHISASLAILSNIFLNSSILVVYKNDLLPIQFKLALDCLLSLSDQIEFNSDTNGYAEMTSEYI